MTEKVRKSRPYRDLEVWKSAVNFVKEIYLITANFPPSEIYGLTGQIRRAAVSIASNIAEGQGRNSGKEFRQFLGFALGSVAEVETLLIIAQEIGYLKVDEMNPYLAAIDHIRKMLRGLSNSLK